MVIGLGDDRKAEVGFTLIEGVFALLLLSLGLLGLGGLYLRATRLLTEAEVGMRAIELASGLVDSLLITSDPVSGELELEGYQAQWWVVPLEVGSSITLELEYDGPVGKRSFEFEFFHQSPLPTLGVDVD